MKLGICLPHYGRPIEPRRMLEVVRRAEERGLDSAWVTDLQTIDLLAAEVRPRLS